MTDGIIQKVCRGWDSEIAIEIENQLIKAIEKEFNALMIFPENIPKWQYEILMKTIIGDSK